MDIFEESLKKARAARNPKRHLAPGEEFAPKGRDDRRGLELIEHGATLRQRETIKQAAEVYAKSYNEVSDCSVYDIVSNLAMYGGRVEVKGLGSFTARAFPGRTYTKEERGCTRGDETRYRPGRFMVEFKMSPLLRDLMNNDWFGDQEEPQRNSEYFIEQKNLML